MPSFSSTSRDRLYTCDNRLINVFNKVIKRVDCTILEGHRSIEDQDKYFREGKSKVKGGESKHNFTPSHAVDVAPYPIDWGDRERFLLFAGYVKGMAANMGIPLRIGADWDGDFTTRDQTFHDAVHFELI